MNEHADGALLIEAYYKIAALITEAGQAFIDAAPSDVERQLRLQGKLMTAVLANFIQTMPGLSAEQLKYMFELAVTVAAHVPDEEAN